MEILRHLHSPGADAMIQDQDGADKPEQQQANDNSSRYKQHLLSTNKDF